jgi:hypothetical protein
LRFAAEFLFAFSTAIKGMLHFVTGDLDGGIALVEQARTLQIRPNDYGGLGLALSFLAEMHFAKGDHERALDLYREALTAFEVVGHRPEIARVQCELGWDRAGPCRHRRVASFVSAGAAIVRRSRAARAAPASR